jgi:hypothetical protein
MGPSDEHPDASRNDPEWPEELVTDVEDTEVIDHHHKSQQQDEAAPKRSTAIWGLQKVYETKSDEDRGPEQTKCEVGAHDAELVEQENAAKGDQEEPEDCAPGGSVEIKHGLFSHLSIRSLGMAVDSSREREGSDARGDQEQGPEVNQVRQ